MRGKILADKNLIKPIDVFSDYLVDCNFVVPLFYASKTFHLLLITNLISLSNQINQHSTIEHVNLA